MDRTGSNKKESTYSCALIFLSGRSFFVLDQFFTLTFSPIHVSGKQP